MYRMLKLPDDMASYFVRQNGFPENNSVFGACDERGFLALCFFDETAEPAEIKGFRVIDEKEGDYWVESLIRAVTNYLELSGALCCIYNNDSYRAIFRRCRFAETDGVMRADLKAIYSAGGHCHE